MKKALIIATFGSTHRDALERDLKPVCDHIKNLVPEWETALAFTSRMVIRRIESRDGEKFMNEIEAIDYFISKGYKKEDIYIQPLHLIPGIEYEKLSIHKKDGVHVGEPLFVHKEDILHFAEKAEDVFRGPAIFVGHGSRHEADEMYISLDEELKSRGLAMAVSTLEGELREEPVFDLFERKGWRELNLYPLLLLAGDHAKNDIAAEKDSYREELEARGFKVHTSLDGLGTYPFIQKMYGEKLVKLIGESDHA